MSHDLEGMLVAVGEVVDDATPERRAWVSAAAEILRRDDLTGGGFPGGRPPRKIVPWLRTITVSSLIAGT
jgi:hypothetical protein